jgi:hypothetical protein
MKKIFILFSFFFLLFFISADEARAQTASLYLSPATGTFFIGSTFDISVFVNTEESSINAVKAVLKFPPDLLQVTSPTAGKSFISIWASQPFYSNQDGIISFQGGVPAPGIKTSSGLVSTITFRAKASGKAVISFSDSSQVFLSDGKGTNILQTSTGGEYFLTLAPPEGPKISSPTHSCLTCWYKNNNPSFFWDKEQGITDFSFSLDQDPRGIPDNESEGSLTSATLTDVADGIWYFHLKAKKSGLWGGVSHYPLQIDQTPPRPFEIKVEKTGNRFFSYFSTDDLLSGIDHYEVGTVDMSNPQAGLSPIFIEAENFYQVPYESPGKYAIVVRAYDKAGNYTEQKSTLTIVSPLLDYTEKGVRLKGIFLPWWLIWVILAIVLIAAGFGTYRLWRQKSLPEKLRKEVSEAEKEISDVKKMEQKIQKMRSLEEEAKREAERLAEKLKGENHNLESRK